MPRAPVDLVAQMVVDLEPAAAFQAFADDLVTGLAASGIRLIPGPDGRALERGQEVGRVVAWVPGKAMRLSWRSRTWAPDPPAEIEIRFRAVSGRTRISVAVHGWGARLGEPASDHPGWFAGQVVAPLLGATAPRALGEWVTDRRARRPSGPMAREVYRDPKYHRPNFKLLLHTLALTPDDYLLEVGCGGGAFLEEALATGCRAAAIDHSVDMVRLARTVNREAIAAARLEIVQADAEAIPYGPGRFSCAVTTGVFAFIRDPAAALAEVLRVLAPGGRFVLFTGTRELAGTPAAPEPIASRLRFYEDGELRDLASAAGFTQVRVERPDLEAYARETGLPEDAMALFRGSGGAQLLVARRP